MNKLTMTQAQKIHHAIFGCDATDRDILRLLNDVEQNLIFCKIEVTTESMGEMLYQWLEEEKTENDASWARRAQLMLDDA